MHDALHFHSRPAELRGADRVASVLVERTTVDDAGAAHGTGETYEVGAQLVIRSVGYRGVALDAKILLRTIPAVLGRTGK